jgi:SAM-dependent methyltransferase
MENELKNRILSQRGWRKSYNIENGINIINLQQLKDKQILEVACGKGLLSVYLSFYAKQVTGVDIFESETIEANKLKVEFGRENCEFVCSDIFQTNFENEKFDIIVAEAALHHIIYDMRIGEKLYDYLKPGGKLIFISEPLSYNFFNELNRFFRHWRKHMFGEFQLWYEHINQFGKKFDNINYYYFDIFSQPFKFLEHILPQRLFRWVMGKLWKVDDLIVRKIPRLRKYSPNVNIEMIKIGNKGC